mgnify:CR=1 FL=1
MDDLLKRVEKIYGECAPEDKKKSEKKMDEFRKKKKEISADIREVREVKNILFINLF